jgi:hypothetical protein
MLGDMTRRARLRRPTPRVPPPLTLRASVSLVLKRPINWQDEPQNEIKRNEGPITLSGRNDKGIAHIINDMGNPSR